ncbi:DNA mismatch endonuclease Vsr [Desulfofarcimen acetoxidans DSM 771]|uniref:DNA mismatch endonuclease Vsr n=1 Tax=Desulfofarcimen acetoxidans (strain ATCC 49208 / DSM 771 / KCTC 5769 / VKM B-1644 / 5575) TaxID=485916 RepID=C8VVT5_DESAS|nr:very short patch repair endonuclease [Desulfofarcimen acetoxidans]ACV62400.1 DNA mismatch endonuclease Vsr [Desulfofarcimen acetoxidans DSM 771]
MARDPQITHKIMSSVKSKDTRPEIALRKALWGMGLRYRINYKQIPGKPDVVFTKARIAVFCDGDYWHGHNWAIRGLKSLDEELSHYSEFWSNKIRGNINRDETVNNELTNMGWHVIRVWESDIKADVMRCASDIKQIYKSHSKSANRRLK